MSDVLNLRREVTGFNKSERFLPYSKIVINVTDELCYEAGDETGRTLTLSCPWGTQAMANNLLSQMRGFAYQPFTAEGAILDPSSELGDGINVNGVYSGIYRMDTKFNSHCSADISAPCDEEIDNEYPYKSKQEREVKRKNKQFASQLAIQANKISAEVEARESDIKSVKATLEVQSNQIVAKINKNEGTSETFGWALETNSWRIFAGTSTVLKATQEGLEIEGKITATSGTIGGFTINSNSINYNGQDWDGTNTTGIYIGPYGIQLGKNFQVDAAGNLKAASGEFSGYVRAQNIKFGTDPDTGTNYGRLDGGGISLGTLEGNRLQSYTIDTSKISEGINKVLGRASDAYDVTHNGVQASELGGATVYAGTLRVSNKMYFGGKQVYLSSIYVNGVSCNVVRWV